MTRNKTFLAVMVLSTMALFTLACEHNPSTPTPPPSPTPTPAPVVTPKPALGTILQDQPVLVPGTTQPLVLWISKLPVPIGGVWTPEDAGLVWACGGPSGYRFLVSKKFVPEGWPDPPTKGPLAVSGGAVLPIVGGYCDSGISSVKPPDYMAGLDIGKVVFLVWFAPEGDDRIKFPDWEADGVATQVLNWKAKR